MCEQASRDVKALAYSSNISQFNRPVFDFGFPFMCVKGSYIKKCFNVIPIIFQITLEPSNWLEKISLRTSQNLQKKKKLKLYSIL